MKAALAGRNRPFATFFALLLLSHLRRVRKGGKGRAERREG